MESFTKQVGGTHYQHLTYQPIKFFMDTNLNVSLSYAIKYLSRDKGSDDLDKAIHCIELYADWYTDKVETGEQYYEPTTFGYKMYVENIFKYTHQFNPEVALAIQKIMKCQDYFLVPDAYLSDEHVFKESEFNSVIEEAIEAIKGLKNETNINN